jgi:predicted nucleic acid-binding protein
VNWHPPEPTTIAVINASPLIFLSRAGQLELLRVLSGSLVVLKPVVEEIARRGPRDPTVRQLAEATWIHPVESPPIPPNLLAWNLGPGESAVLAYALKHRGTTAILDDLAARRCAETLQIPKRGTLGIVLLAKQQGQIPQARPLLESLRRSGMYLSNRVLNEVLALVGE